MKNQAVFTSIDLNKYHYLDTIHKMIISHRGKKTGERENSIAAFEKAFAMGAEGIECDARITKDGKIIIYHDYFLRKNGRSILIPKNKLSDIMDFAGKEKPHTLFELLDFVKKKNKPFFIELKSSSPVLVDKIAQELSKRNLWDKVCVIGFSVMIRMALKMQKKYPKLRVIPFLNLPALAFIRGPKKSYGIFMGWIDEWRLSQKFFQTTISQKRLEKLKNLYDKKGFKVMAGVINNEKGLKYFREAGITDIVTDEIELAKKILDGK